MFRTFLSEFQILKQINACISDSEVLTLTIHNSSGRLCVGPHSGSAVIPAKAGIHVFLQIPASAGMTGA
jgi:hypothetical protein